LRHMHAKLVNQAAILLSLGLKCLGSGVDGGS
jgi:hypothetical protein